MDIAEHHRNLADPAWRRWLLLGALVLVGASYVVAYSLFLMRGEDFLAARYNQRAMEFSGTHVISLPTKLSFGLGEPDNARLGSGWHPPDTSGVWSEAVDAFVEIAIPRQRSALLLRLNTTVFVAKQRSRMKIKAVINGVPAGEWKRGRANASEPLDAYIPATSSPTDQLTIHLKLDHIASPFRSNSGADSRELGLLLYSIELRDARDQAVSAPSQH